MAQTNAERVAAYRARRRADGGTDTTRRNRRAEKAAWKSRRRNSRAFVGCDGEGAGVDQSGRQNYLLFRMGSRELYSGVRLQTDEILPFICDHPSSDILVGFAFGYDTTMILRDLPDAQKAKLFAPKEFGPGKSRYVYYRDFDIDYLPKQYLTIRRTRTIRVAGEWKRVPIKGSQRTIFETFGFFQKSFLKVLEEFKVGTEDERRLIADSKSLRGSDEWAITDTERRYCALECELLGELMERLREYCAAAEIVPRSWNGAGKLAKALHRQHGTLKAGQINELVPQGVRDFANMGYYGGRFEITRTGRIKRKVYEYDIASAYPRMMSDLPCLEHGTWEPGTPAQIRAHAQAGGLYCAAVTFKHERRGDGMGQLGTLPIRSREGHLYWPLTGGGVYWSPEIKSAERAGAKITFKSGWRYTKRCDCKPYEWVEALFDYRRSIGKSGPGYPIKLGINSLYGALAQRIGSGQFANMVHAGLITAFTRAWLNDAVTAASPGSIVMLATDGVYSLEPIPALDAQVGDRLGDWEREELDGLMIVQPGLYWCPALRKRKSRGLSGRFFEEPGRTEGFERAWARWLRQAPAITGNPETFPAVSVPVPGFIGLKLAHARNAPEKAGTWVEETRTISFDWTNKRTGFRIENGHAVTGIKTGTPGLYSLPHREFLAKGGAEPWEAARAMLDEQPDYVDLGIPFKD